MSISPPNNFSTQYSDYKPAAYKTIEQRREAIGNQLVKNNGGPTNPKSENPLDQFTLNCPIVGDPDYGLDFNWIPHEERFYDHLKTIDQDDKHTVIVGCGLGRNVIDALSVTQSINITANDLSKESLGQLSTTIGKVSPMDTPRIKLKLGDVNKYLTKHEKNSIDCLHSANLLHFFNTAQINTFVVEVDRTLKQNSRLFLFFQDQSDEITPSIVKDKLIAKGFTLTKSEVSYVTNCGTSEKPGCSGAYKSKEYVDESTGCPNYFLEFERH